VIFGIIGENPRFGGSVGRARAEKPEVQEDLRFLEAFPQRGDSARQSAADKL
jgi:hypothetical protein